MESTTKARPNHYETLGLAPGASDDEIARSYAREVGMFGSRPVSDVARASIAFETLRDPTRRRAYDRSLGLGSKAPPRIVSTAGRAQFVGFAASSPLAPLQPMAAKTASESLPPQSPSEPRTASFIAASLRPPAVPPHKSQPRAMEVEPLRHPERPRTAELRLADADDSPVRLSRTVAIGAGLIGCVVALGAMLGLEAGNGEQQPAEAAVTAALPAPRPAAPAAMPSPEPSPGAQFKAERGARAAVVAARRARPAVAPQRQAPVPAFAEAAPAVPAAPVEAEAAATDPLAPAPVAAALPLSNATIARTIERIGYACGRVASTGPDDSGAAGVFKVTCTSGHSYRAAPVHGRYRFRRVAGR